MNEEMIELGESSEKLSSLEHPIQYVSGMCTVKMNFQSLKNHRISLLFPIWVFFFQNPLKYGALDDMEIFRKIKSPQRSEGKAEEFEESFPYSPTAGGDKKGKQID